MLYCKHCLILEEPPRTRRGGFFCLQSFVRDLILIANKLLQAVQLIVFLRVLPQRNHIDNDKPNNSDHFDGNPE